jgi:hypothetical protein
MSWPIRDLSIERFRGLRDLHLDELGQINLFVGPNNSGKTSVLEALSLYCAPLEPWSWITLSGRREPAGFVGGSRIRNVDRLRWLFPQMESADPSLLYAGSVRVSANGSADVRGFQAEYHERRGCHIEVSITAGNVQGALFGFGELGAQTNSFIFWEDERFSSPRRNVGPSVSNEFITAYDHWFRGISLRRFSDARLGGVENFVDAVLELLKCIDPRIVGLEVLATERVWRRP